MQSQVLDKGRDTPTHTTQDARSIRHQGGDPESRPAREGASHRSRTATCRCQDPHPHQTGQDHQDGADQGGIASADSSPQTYKRILT